MLRLLSVCLLLAWACSADDRIVNLPGAPSVNFTQYAGYITVDEVNGRALFYWFVESQHNPATDPLVLWLNGGPGCSSLNGMLTENGPFTVNKDGATLRLNPWAWNQIANVIYLESPAGVGFSYSNTSSDYTVGDARTAQDSLVFLQKFLQLYPQYQNSPFWVTGESYGGHYVPGLAWTILQANKQNEVLRAQGLSAPPSINLTGFQVGNAWTDAALDNQGAVLQWWSHAFISDDDYVGIVQNCDFSNIGPLIPHHPHTGNASLCNQYVNDANNVMEVINIYDLYTDVCLSTGHDHDAAQFASYIYQARSSLQGIDLFKKRHSATAAARSQARARSAPSLQRVHDEIPDPDPCVSNHLSDYLNQKDVQQALHADISYPWYGCSPFVQYSYTDLLSSMLPTYMDLVKSGIRILVFSGDVDGIVPVTGTRSWLAKLNQPITTPWYPWIDEDQQTGGYVVEYEGLTFATVRDAGHMVPWFQPHRSFTLFSRFLQGQPL